MCTSINLFADVSDLYIHIFEVPSGKPYVFRLEAKPSQSFSSPSILRSNGSVVDSSGLEPCSDVTGVLQRGLEPCSDVTGVLQMRLLISYICRAHYRTAANELHLSSADYNRFAVYQNSAPRILVFIIKGVNIYRIS